MDFNHLATLRYSCRAYSSEPVEQDKLMRVLEGVRLAPSACNRQPWRFVVITDTDERMAACSTYGRDFPRQAPVIILAVGRHAEAWHRPFDGKDHTDVDLSIAIEHLCLAAAEQGLGTCWICNFDPEVMHKVLPLPEDEEVIAMIPLGYPAKDSAVPEKKRKDMDQIVQWGLK